MISTLLLEVLVPHLTMDLECHVARARRTEHYCEFLLEPGEGQALKVDLARCRPPARRAYQGRHRHGGYVENIGANKLTAILGRTEPKDFVDLYFILHAGYDFDDLLEKAKTKDLCLQPSFMVGSLLQVRQSQHLPQHNATAGIPRTPGRYHLSDRPAARPVAAAENRLWPSGKEGLK